MMNQKAESRKYSCMIINDTRKKQDIFMLQVRLYRLAQLRWNISQSECNKLFKKYDIYRYIEDCYEEYHIQGDETNIDDIENYLKNRGFSFDHN